MRFLLISYKENLLVSSRSHTDSLSYLYACEKDILYSHVKEKADKETPFYPPKNNAAL